MSALVSGHAQQRPARRGQPILFSEPRSATSLSNLNQIAAQKGEVPNPGRELRKPSEIFDAGGANADFIGPFMRQLPPPQVNSKKLRELLKKREDKAFQTPEDLTRMLTAEEIFKIPELDQDGLEKKDQTALERAYERLEREHLGTTNQMQGDQLFGRQQDNEGSDNPAFVVTEKTPGTALGATVLKPQPLFGADSSSALFPDPVKSTGFSDDFGSASFESPDAARARATRLLNYKQLLDGGSRAPLATAGPAVNSLNNTPAAVPGGPSAPGLDSLSGATPRGLLPATTAGAPQGYALAPGNAQSLTPPPPPRTSSGSG